MPLVHPPLDHPPQDRTRVHTLTPLPHAPVEGKHLFVQGLGVLCVTDNRRDTLQAEIPPVVIEGDPLRAPYWPVPERNKKGTRWHWGPRDLTVQ